MNAHVHYRLTKQWAEDVGFSASEAEIIARADVGVDRVHRGADSWRNLPWHWRWFGARRVARRLMDVARTTGDLHALGEALHAEQDAISHGHLGHLWHWPGIDLWERRSPRMQLRLENRSRVMLTDIIQARYTRAMTTPDAGVSASPTDTEAARPA